MFGERFKMGRAVQTIRFNDSLFPISGYRFGHGVLNTFAYRDPISRMWKIYLVDRQVYSTLWGAASMARRYLIVQRTFFN